MTSTAANRFDPLLADWHASLVEDGDREWHTTWKVLAARAASLVEDWPVASAMVRARLLRVLGSRGLKFRSALQLDLSGDVTGTEQELRTVVENVVASGSRSVAVHTDRLGLEWDIAYDAIVYGDGFAVRFLDLSAPVGRQTRWRHIAPWRVAPPPDKAAAPAYTGGIELDPVSHAPVALWVQTARNTFQRIPWVAPDGTPNVVHATGLVVSGSRRGVSEFTPMIVTARMLQQIDLAYATLKRVQASHPMVLKVDDLRAAREQYRGTKLSNLLIDKGHEIEFTDLRFEGSDYRDFVDAALRSLCAAWQLPWELVLGDYAAKSGASSRSLWQQHYLAADREQAKHALQVTSVIDRSLIAEAVAVGQLRALPLDLLAAADYAGPPQIYPDPAKEAEWARTMLEIGMSPSTVFARLGEDYRLEAAQRARDLELARSLGLQSTGSESEGVNRGTTSDA